MQALGFNLVPGEHPIIPVMLGDAPLAVRLAERMQAEGVYVVAFSFPVVPHGKARIRTQMNAAHTHAATRSGDCGVRAFGARSRHHSLEAVHESIGQGARGTRHLDAGRPRTLSRATTTCSSRCIAPRSAAPTCTSTTGMRGRRKRCRCRWRSATNIRAKSSKWAAKCAASTPATACPARATSPAAIAAIAAPDAGTCAAILPAWASTEPGAFAEYLTIPATNVFKLPARHRR